jgi:hypothetical protein
LFASSVDIPRPQGKDKVIAPCFRTDPLYRFRKVVAERHLASTLFGHRPGDETGTHPRDGGFVCPIDRNQEKTVSLCQDLGEFPIKGGGPGKPMRLEQGYDSTAGEDRADSPKRCCHFPGVMAVIVVKIYLAHRTHVLETTLCSLERFKGITCRFKGNVHAG